MTRENLLTHHEKLRYDYLLKNIYYLNEKEKREFDFLQAKLDDQQASSGMLIPEVKKQAFSESSTDLPTYANRSRSTRRKDTDPKVKKVNKKVVFRLKRLLVWIVTLLLCLAAGMTFMFLKGFQSTNPKDAKAAQVKSLMAKILVTE